MCEVKPAWEPEERARNYVAAMPPAIQGSGGSQACWRVAQVLARGFALPRDQAAEILAEYNLRCQPPWSKKELTHKLDDAYEKSKVPKGYLLDDQGRALGDEFDAEPIQSNVRQLRPMQRATVPSAPVPIAPAAVTDEWESWWLPEPARAWVDACAACYCVPKVMPIMAVCCARSILLQGKLRVRINSSWDEPVNLYWLLFAPTGMAKSAVMKAAMAPVRAMQRSIEDQLAPVIAEKTSEKAYLEAQVQRLRRAAVPKDKETREQAREDRGILARQLRETVVPVPPKWLNTDVNPTVIPRLMAHNLAAEGIARTSVCDAEGSFLANLMGRHSGNLNVDPLLLAFNGDPSETSRTAPNSTTLQEWRLPATYMTMAIMVQPHYLDKLKAHPELGDNGWLGRCIISRVERDPMPTPFERPAIPDQVSEAYAEWLMQTATVEDGVEFCMPTECKEELERMHNSIEEDSLLSQGAKGWSKRRLGIICRIIALIHAEESNCRTVELSKSGPGGRVCGVLKILSYLYNTLYSRALSQAQDLEPARYPLPSLSRRALRWLRQFNRSTVTLRDLQRGLRISKSDALATCDLLCESGHLELADEKRRHNQTLTLAYTVVSTDPDCGEQPSVDS